MGVKIKLNDLAEVDGIGDKTLKRIREYLIEKEYIKKKSLEEVYSRI